MLKQIVTILILINLIFCTNEIRELEPKSVFNAFWEISQSLLKFLNFFKMLL